MGDVKMKLYIWNNPYDVLYGGSCLYVLAHNLKEARKLALTSVRANYGDPWSNETIKIIVGGKPSRVINKLYAEVYEWQQVKNIREGQIFYTYERILDDKGGREIRKVFYIRDPDRVCKYPHNVAIGRYGIIQGEYLMKPRYIRMHREPCRDPGEMDGRIIGYVCEKDILEYYLSGGSVV